MRNTSGMNGYVSSLHIEFYTFALIIKWANTVDTSQDQQPFSI